MGKMKAVAAERQAATTAATDVTLVMFGRDERGKPHASTFTAEEQELAERAAGLMSMRVLRVANDEHRAAASELPTGRVFASGKGFVPFVAEGTHARLEAFPEASQPSPPVGAVAPVHTAVPASWAVIDVGGLVLAAETPRAGFFEAVVISAPGDDMFELRWLSWPDLPPFIRRRGDLALLTEAVLQLPDGAEAGVEGEPLAADA